MIPTMISRVFGAMDSKRDLRDLITQAEFEEGVVWDEQVMADFHRIIHLLAEYGYIVLEVRK